MKNHRWILSLVLVSTAAATTASAQASKPAKTADANYVSVVPHEADRRVDITVGGKPFTSYVWPTTLKKPVLYPIVSSKGVKLSPETRRLSKPQLPRALPQRRRLASHFAW